MNIQPKPEAYVPLPLRIYKSYLILPPDYHIFHLLDSRSLPLLRSASSATAIVREARFMNRNLQTKSNSPSFAELSWLTVPESLYSPQTFKYLGFTPSASLTASRLDVCPRPNPLETLPMFFHGQDWLSDVNARPAYVEVDFFFSNRENSNKCLELHQLRFSYFLGTPLDVLDVGCEMSTCTLYDRRMGIDVVQIPIPVRRSAGE